MALLMQSSALSLPCRIAILHPAVPVPCHTFCCTLPCPHPVLPYYTPCQTLPYSHPAVPCHTLCHTHCPTLAHPAVPCHPLQYSSIHAVPGRTPCTPCHTLSFRELFRTVPDPKERRANERLNVTTLHCLVQFVSHACIDSTFLHCCNRCTAALATGQQMHLRVSPCQLIIQCISQSSSQFTNQPINHVISQSINHMLRVCLWDS